MTKLYWCRLSTDFWVSPKVLRLLRVCDQDEMRWRRALAVFQTLIGLNTEADSDGSLRDHYVEPRFLSMRSSVSEEQLLSALRDLESGDLISLSHEPPAIALIGWGDEWRSAKTSTARTRAWRQRRASDD